ncbi:ComF family protein [Candidatus Woesebacteria bacterium]|nr:ComF family protein [Candidatus Woesebacteria bacterium]
MGVFDLIFPRKCFGCGKDGNYICSSCAGKLKPSRQICGVCTKPSPKGLTHLKCRYELSLDGLAAIWEYEGSIRRAILSLKYKFAYEVSQEIADLVVEKLKRKVFLPPKPTLIPIPLHWQRQNWRGFNQMQEIGKKVALRMRWKFIPDLIVRRSASPPQTELKRKERVENIRGTFVINRKYLPLKPKPLVLFDDVWTTGSTVKEAAKVLKERGAKEVWGLTITKGH